MDGSFPLLVPLRESWDLSPSLQHWDVCAGIGGASLAAEAEGLRTTVAVENSTAAVAVLRANWPDLTIYGDLCDATWWSEVVQGGCDVLTASFPCQPYSRLGRQRLADMRAAVLAWVALLCWLSQPRLVVLENVPGLQDMPGAVEAVLQLFRLVGYVGHTRVIDGTPFAPQTHRRLYFLLGPVQFPFPPLPEAVWREEEWRHVPCSLGQRQALETGDGPVELEWTALEAELFDDLARRPSHTYRRVVGPVDVAPTIPRLYGQAQWIPALRGQFIHGFGVVTSSGRRFLSGREVARIMGFPEVFRLSAATRVAWELLGNAVIPAQAAFVMAVARGVVDPHFEWM